MLRIPVTYEEAISSTYSNHWKWVMKEEMKALEDRDTYEVTPVPDEKPFVRRGTFLCLGFY